MPNYNRYQTQNKIDPLQIVKMIYGGGFSSLMGSDNQANTIPSDAFKANPAAGAQPEFNVDDWSARKPVMEWITPSGNRFTQADIDKYGTGLYVKPSDDVIKRAPHIASSINQTNAEHEMKRNVLMNQLGQLGINYNGYSPEQLGIATGGNSDILSVNRALQGLKENVLNVPSTQANTQDELARKTYADAQFANTLTPLEQRAGLATATGNAERSEYNLALDRDKQSYLPQQKEVIADQYANALEQQQLERDAQTAQFKRQIINAGLFFPSKEGLAQANLDTGDVRSVTTGPLVAKVPMAELLKNQPETLPSGPKFIPKQKPEATFNLYENRPIVGGTHADASPTENTTVVGKPAITFPVVRSSDDFYKERRELLAPRTNRIAELRMKIAMNKATPDEIAEFTSLTEMSF